MRMDVRIAKQMRSCDHKTATLAAVCGRAGLTQHASVEASVSHLWMLPSDWVGVGKVKNLLRTTDLVDGRIILAISAT